jgi:23S rRNA pseudouridine1911/1915/1917 synthase
MSTLHRVKVSKKGRVDAILAESVPDLSRARIAALIREGAVTLDGEPVARPAAKAYVDGLLELTIPEPVADRALPQDLPLSVIYQDADVVVVDKAAGMVVHPGAGHADGTLVNALLHHIGDLSGIGGVQRPGIVHRLDRGTTGLLVVAKHDVAHQSLAGQFAAHTAGRRYLALVHGTVPLPEGCIESHLARHTTNRRRFSSVEEGGKRAVTHWRRLAQRGVVALMECRLETGRTHQIRVHLTEGGWPLLGDGLYKRRHNRIPPTLKGIVSNLGNRPMLHARELRFDHPRTGEAMQFRADFPADFAAALAALEIVLER